MPTDCFATMYATIERGKSSDLKIVELLDGVLIVS